MKVNYINQSGRAARLRRADIDNIARRAFRLSGQSGKNLELSLIMIDKTEARRLNSVYRGRFVPANVLSFSAGRKKDLGDIFVCPAVAEQEAKRERISAPAKLKHLFVHGLLHLLGYDHKAIKDEKAMIALEQKILS